MSSESVRATSIGARLGDVVYLQDDWDDFAAVLSPDGPLRSAARM
ncbi:MAG TPA: hypothetical protein VI300_30955 [Solirubrobacter sp.]